MGDVATFVSLWNQSCNGGRPDATASVSLVCHTLSVSILAVNSQYRGGMVAWPKKKS